MGDQMERELFRWVVMFLSMDGMIWLLSPVLWSLPVEDPYPSTERYFQVLFHNLAFALLSFSASFFL